VLKLAINLRQWARRVILRGYKLESEFSELFGRFGGGGSEAGRFGSRSQNQAIDDPKHVFTTCPGSSPPPLVMAGTRGKKADTSRKKKASAKPAAKRKVRSCYKHTPAEM
jgi:hypothetical protein